MSKVGKDMASREVLVAGWDSPSCLNKAEVDFLLSEYRKFLDRVHEGKLSACKPRGMRKNLIFLASDSCEASAAGLWLRENSFVTLVDTSYWSKRPPSSPEDDAEADDTLPLPKDFEQRFEHDMSINWKETYVAIRTIRRFLQKAKERGIPLDDDLEIVFGEDNTTALAALNNFYFSSDLQLCGELYRLFDELGDVSLTCFYVPTELMPADEPSRGRPVNSRECRETIDLLRKEYKARGGSLKPEKKQV
jgi:hypothetical protein